MGSIKYTLRKSNEDDFEFVFDLNKANMRKYVEALRGWDDEAEREDMRRHFRPGSDRIIALDGKDIGRLAVDCYADRIDLRHIEILPECQGQGIGTAIIRDILGEARQAKLPVTLIVLDMNPAKRLYERLGFRTVEEIDARQKGIKCRMAAAAL
jgi:ribosomal protein S18 acetylase RimI-like enzyme